MKRLITSLLATLMLLSVVCAPTMALNAEEMGRWYQSANYFSENFNTENKLMDNPVAETPVEEVIFNYDAENSIDEGVRLPYGKYERIAYEHFCEYYDLSTDTPVHFYYNSSNGRNHYLTIWVAFAEEGIYGPQRSLDYSASESTSTIYWHPSRNVGSVIGRF